MAASSYPKPVPRYEIYIRVLETTPEHVTTKDNGYDPYKVASEKRVIVEITTSDDDLLRLTNRAVDGLNYLTPDKAVS